MANNFGGPLDISEEQFSAYRDYVEGRDRSEERRNKKTDAFQEDYKTIKPAIGSIDVFMQKHLFDMSFEIVEKWVELRDLLKLPIVIKV